MNVESVQIVLPEDAWGYLLQRQEQPTGWPLPFTTQPQPEHGKLWLVQQGLLVAGDAASVLHTALQQTIDTVIETRWVLDIKADGARGALLRVAQGWLWAQPMQGQRIAVKRVSQPVDAVEQAVQRKQADYGLSIQGVPQWTGSMAWEQALGWLKEQLKGR